MCGTRPNTYTVEGMTCGACATKVTGAVSEVTGVCDTDVDLATGTLTISGDAADADVRSAIASAGYRVI